MSKKNKKPRQLSEQDVYRDAAHILEEFLENKLGPKSLQSNGSSITNTNSSSGYYDASRESLDIWFKDDNTSHNFNIERSQTMPSSFKLDDKDEFTAEDIKEYMKTKSDFANRRHSGSATSGESDVLDSRVGAPLRRKKSFYKRAKERLSITFRRQEREKENEEKEEEDIRKERKKKKKNDKNDQKSSTIEVNGGELDDEFDDEVQLRRGGNRKRSDSTASKRSSIFESFRRSFRSKRKSTTIFESQSADAIIDNKTSDKRTSDDGKKTDKIPQRTTPPPVKDPKKEETKVPPIPLPYIDTSHSIDLDDIKYIDDETTTDQNKNKTGELPKPSRSRNKPAPPPPKAPPLHNGTSNGTSNSTSDAGNLTLGDSLNTNIATCTNDNSGDDVDSPDKKDENIPFHEKSDSEKDDLMEKIAAKLMDMADKMDKSKSSSDTDGGHIRYAHDNSSSVDPEQLTALEQEILDCLRVGGDRLSQSFDDPVQVVVEQHRKQAYLRFYDTLRKGLGDEISWNQLSLIYQTTAGAIKAAGAGTQLAYRVKDMTQQYVGDKFASWIVREGGWDSMLSESESEVTS
ncbi:hypothetical protein LOTGIDRAFT_161792 [Lottia gigantea]|uniref:Uncharacterized protein n=1 Tax=Lottia gigantea TaxID=225164 RepID=V4BVZ1_LOTGI|nr:hypothetical protein LOTGIDRAFT_161792 [Lottia gigantea]ESO93239.1 hypothetical protein LOTGIDRAFT_161792 [Lottia gigantea]